MAIEVIKDFDRLDQADSTITLLELEIDSYVRQLTLQDRIVFGQQEQIESLNEIIHNKAEIISLSSEEVELWKKQYRKQKRQKCLVGGISLGLIALLVIAN